MIMNDCGAENVHNYLWVFYKQRKYAFTTDFVHHII